MSGADQRVQEEVSRITTVYKLQNESLTSQLKSIGSDLQQKTLEYEKLRSQHNQNVSIAVLISVSVSALIIGVLLSSLF